MPATKISVDKAKKDKLFYFVSNVVVYRESDGRCLLLKRADTELVHPGKYCTIGGKLEHSDIDLNNPSRMNGEVYDFEKAIEDSLAREVMEEAGIKVHPDEWGYVNSMAFVRPDETPVVMIKLAAKYMSGDIVMEEGKFSEFAWVNEEEARALPCVEGIAEEVAKTIKIFGHKVVLA